MIYDVASYYLNKIIEKEIRDIIEGFWKSNRDYWINFNYFFGEREVSAFIYSSPYFSQDLKEFLNDTESFIFIEVTKEWYDKFLESVYLWAESDQWLYPDEIFSDDLSLGKGEFDILDLTPQNKELLYRKNIF